jgi:hypothetical protein
VFFKKTSKNKEFIIAHGKRPKILVCQRTSTSTELKEAGTDLQESKVSLPSLEHNSTQDNIKVELSHPCSDFISVLASKLAKLDYRLASGSMTEV